MHFKEKISISLQKVSSQHIVMKESVSRKMLELIQLACFMHNIATPLCLFMKRYIQGIFYAKYDLVSRIVDVASFNLNINHETWLVFSLYRSQEKEVEFLKQEI